MKCILHSAPHLILFSLKGTDLLPRLSHISTQAEYARASARDLHIYHILRYTNSHLSDSSFQPTALWLAFKSYIFSLKFFIACCLLVTQSTFLATLSNILIILL